MHEVSIQGTRDRGMKVYAPDFKIIWHRDGKPKNMVRLVLILALMGPCPKQSGAPLDELHQLLERCGGRCRRRVQQHAPPESRRHAAPSFLTSLDEGRCACAWAEALWIRKMSRMRRLAKSRPNSSSMPRPASSNSSCAQEC